MFKESKLLQSLLYVFIAKKYRRVFFGNRSLFTTIKCSKLQLKAVNQLSIQTGTACSYRNYSEGKFGSFAI